MWQFIPDTAKTYGLTVGPLVPTTADPGDDRHKWEKATRAAAAYIKDIYSTDAQASGLLVMASYNWASSGSSECCAPCRRIHASATSGRCSTSIANRCRRDLQLRHADRVRRRDWGNPKLFGFDFDSPLAANRDP